MAKCEVTVNKRFVHSFIHPFVNLFIHPSMSETYHKIVKKRKHRNSSFSYINHRVTPSNVSLANRMIAQSSFLVDWSIGKVAIFGVDDDDLVHQAALPTEPGMPIVFNGGGVFRFVQDDRNKTWVPMFKKWLDSKHPLAQTMNTHGLRPFGGRFGRLQSKDEIDLLNKHKDLILDICYEKMQSYNSLMALKPYENVLYRIDNLEGDMRDFVLFKPFIVSNWYGALMERIAVTEEEEDA